MLLKETDYEVQRKNYRGLQATINGLAILADDLFNGDKAKTMNELCQCDPDDVYGATLVRMVKDLHTLAPVLQAYAAWRKAQTGRV